MNKCPLRGILQAGLGMAKDRVAVNVESIALLFRNKVVVGCGEV